MAQRKDWFTRFFRGGKHREQAAGTGCLSPADKPQGREAAKGGEGEEKDLGYRVPTRRAGHAAPLGCGCCGPIPGVRVIEVKGDQVGLLGLDEILAEVRRLGLEDEDRIKDELLARVKQRNYVTPGYEPAYREALWREYRARRSAS